MFDSYYDSYWEKRINKSPASPIPSGLPVFLKKFTSYGAILSQIKKCHKILDIGCGDGNVTQIYLEKGEVYGIDISPFALKAAAKKGIKTSLQDLNNLPLKFPENSFDYVIATDVAEHLIDPVNLLKEVKRVLKKNGMFILTVPNFARIGNRFRMFAGDPIDLLHWSKYGDELEHLHWFTIPKINYLLKKESFKKIKYVSTGLKGDFIFGLLKIPSLGKMLTVISEK